jgi:hypothetical protein
MSQTKAQLISDLVQALNFTGTASAPANGLFLSASNQLKLATASTERLKIDGTEVVFNDDGASVDFRVEGDTSTHLLFVDASADKIGIGVSNPANTLEISGTFQSSTDANTASYTQAFNLTNAINADFNVHLKTGSTTIGSGTTTPLCFHIGGTANERMRIDSSGNVGIGTTSPGSKLQIATTAVDTDVFRIMRQDNTGISLFRVFQDSSSGGGTGGCHINSSNRDLMISASTNGDADDGLYLKTTGELGIGTSSPTHMLDISGSNPILALNDTDTTNDRFRLTYNGGSSQLQVDPNNVRSGSHLLVAVDGTERMRIDSSGRVLIGTTSGSDALVVDGGSDAGTITTNSTNSNGNMMTFNCSGTGKFFIGSAGSFITGNSGTTNQGIRAEGSLLFAAGGHTERMRIDSSGNVLIGVNTTGSTSEGMTIRPGNESTLFRDSGFVFLIGGGQSGQRLIDFRQGGTSIGHISKSGTTNVSYSTSSDYRLKENVVAISDGITRLKTLKPYRFNFKADADRTVDGFFAHEVTAVPEAIAGTKDEVDSDNNPVYQGIDHSKLVPLLVAAVQELITKVETLEAA